MEMGDAKKEVTESIVDVRETSSDGSTTEGSPGEEVRTLFVSGLPMDASARELYLLCRSCKGYVDSKLNNARNKYGKPLPPIGFVTFASRAEAMSALAELQNVSFDPCLSGTIRLEFAKSNSKGPKHLHPSLKKAEVTGESSSLPTNSLYRGGGMVLQPPATTTANPMYTTFLPGSTFMLPSQRFVDPHFPPYVHSNTEQGAFPYGDTIYNSISCNPATIPYTCLPGSTTPSANPQTLSTFTTANNSPTSTLFVANLGPFATERELTEIFGASPGFLSVRLYTKGASPVAFVKYADTRCATQAMTACQGAALRYSDRGGIRIEFARSKIGERESLLASAEDSLTGGDNNCVAGCGWGPIFLPPIATNPCKFPVS